MNPSFEDSIQCVVGNSQFQGFVTDWRGCCGDYFSTICQGGQVEVPTNILGHSYPHSGLSYTGCYVTIFDNASAHENLRDYIEGQLTSLLQPGWNYCVSFYVSAADLDRYSAPIGFYFSTDSLQYNQYWLNIQPDYMDTALTQIGDTSGWVLVSANFTATGGERYIVIGNHWNDTLLSLRTVNPNAASNFSASYYYIDDVSVTPTADARCKQDTLICKGDSLQLCTFFQPGLSYSWTNGGALVDSHDALTYAKPTTTTTYILQITDSSGLYCTGKMIDSITVYVEDCFTGPPRVPTILIGGELITIQNLHPGTSFQLYDIRGRLVYQTYSYQNDLSSSLFDAAIYTWRLIEPQGTMSSGKLCIMK